MITIQEVNDLPPVFDDPWTPTSPYYVLGIRERRRPGTIVTIMNARTPNNVASIIHYLLVNDTGEFDLVPETGQSSKMLSFLVAGLPQCGGQL